MIYLQTSVSVGRFSSVGDGPTSSLIFLTSNPSNEQEHRDISFTNQGEN